jgi:hypothetical protein
LALAINFLSSVGGTLWNLQKLLCQIFEFVPSIFFLYPPNPITGIVLAGLIFPFTHMCTQYLYHIHTPTHFSPSPPPALIPTTYQDQFCPSIFWSWKKSHFSLFIIAIQVVSGSFLVAFPCIYALLPKLVHLLYFSSFFFSLLLIVVSTGLESLYSFMYREYINNIHLLTSFFFYLLFSVSCFSKSCCTCIRSVLHIWQKMCRFWPSEPD